MITAHASGHPIKYANEWVYSDTGQPVNHHRPCKKCGKNPRLVAIDGQSVSVDHCIADQIVAANAGALKTKSCCCGHGIFSGYIMYKNGQATAVNQNTIEVSPCIPKEIDEIPMWRGHEVEICETSLIDGRTKAEQAKGRVVYGVGSNGKIFRRAEL